jgi:flavin reductase (DIM6/NTAB) family NADH-FMN oxidoreductase RutF
MVQCAVLAKGGRLSIDANEYRRIISCFATGVTVVTTAVDGWLHGMTANALTSVSLDPLLLLVCVEKTAHAHEQFEGAGRFAVNILADDQQAISDLFAVSAEPQEGHLRDVDYRLSPRGTPLIDGCLAYLECEVADRCPGGDHTIFIGAVVDGEVLRDAPPLLYHRSTYRRIDAAG